ncbi:hypothetical protein [Rhizobium mayense]|uniref:Transposase n=1 Tax=Rhizobium mayense TaxID=1312184 RepID=A0ABT7K294_9HYPH|nr:hypothetical protein [Rhizobium mayense]MDL2402093.1 hypothetical protein [Rhizobium mayense]
MGGSTKEASGQYDTAFTCLPTAQLSRLLAIKSNKTEKTARRATAILFVILEDCHGLGPNEGCPEANFDIFAEGRRSSHRDEVGRARV